MILSRRLQSRNILLLVLVSAIFFFQNCSGYKSGDPVLKPSNKFFGGDGYPGKVFVNEGDCGNDKIGIKSVIAETTPGEYAVVRANCADLTTPTPTNSSAFRYSDYDQTVFLNRSDVFDQRFTVTSENKLTTAFCYADGENAGLEVMIWYNSDSFESSADPRLATELFGRVTLPNGASTGLVSFPLPKVFTDKLVYDSNPNSPSVELVETRSGVNSLVRFEFDGLKREVGLSCYAQAAPKFLEPSQGYFLKLAPEIAANGTQYAVLSHVSDSDLFKKIDESAPQFSPNTLEGWNAGYLAIAGKVYEMRKQADGSICLGPGEDPRLPCEMQVLGTIKSDDFPTLYSNQSKYAATLTRNLKESGSQLLLANPTPTNRTENMVSDYYKACGANSTYPKHIDYWRSAQDIQLASEVLIHLDDPTAYLSLRAALITDMQNLMDALPGDVLHFPTWDCTNDNIQWGAEILNALNQGYLATKLTTVPGFLQSKGSYIAQEILFAKSSIALYRREKMAPLLSAMVVADRFGAAIYDRSFENFAVAGVIKDQVLDMTQAKCDDGTTLVFGGWKKIGDGHCGHDRISSTRLVNALMDLHEYLSTRKLCASDLNCDVIQRAVVAYLGFHYKFPSSKVYEFNSSVDLAQRLRVIPRLFGYAYRFGLKGSDKVQIGFSASETMDLSSLQTAMISNSPILGDYDSAIQSYGVLEMRLAELTTSPY
jgi:hypothetical protein